MTERSLLFVPGIRPDRFDKARNAGADGVILDLEDAVPADRKAAARQAVMSWLSADRRGHAPEIRPCGISRGMHRSP